MMATHQAAQREAAKDMNTGNVNVSGNKSAPAMKPAK